MASDDKNNNSSEQYVEIRWRIPKRIHKKIAIFQTDNDMVTMESAGIKLLDQITNKIKVIHQ